MNPVLEKNISRIRWISQSLLTLTGYPDKEPLESLSERKWMLEWQFDGTYEGVSGVKGIGFSVFFWKTTDNDGEFLPPKFAINFAISGDFGPRFTDVDQETYESILKNFTGFYEAQEQRKAS